MAKVSIAEHIEITKGVCGGKPRIAGHRIRVQDIAILYEKLGMSQNEIVSRYPSITLADIHAALTYYYDHRDEIEKDIRKGDALVAELKKRFPSKIPGMLSG
ncbi:MAG TPA: DUF433 domain-containing protein [Spirochaetes bacterium]|nr:DUF433 domain-containing protein [Spirochaetota bacterium]